MGESGKSYNYIQGGRRKRLLERMTGLRAAEAERERRPDVMDAQYIWIDSPLYGRQYEDGSFDAFFKPSLPKGEKDLGDYVESVIDSGEGEQEAIGLELGGQGRQLFEDFEEHFPGLFSRSIALVLAEYSPPEKAGRHTPIDHTIMEGDMLDPLALDRLEAALAGKKVKFVIVRLGAGWDMIATKEPYHIVRALQRVYGMVAEGGVMFLEVPNDLKPFMDEWLAAAAPAVTAKKLEAQYALRGKTEQEHEELKAALRIRKLADEPLPMLDPRAAKRIIES